MIWFKRLYNFLVIICSYALSALTKRIFTAPYPFAISVEPTNCCQLRCVECPTGNTTLTRSKGEMDWNVFKQLIDSVSSYTFYLNLYFQGEPLLHKDIIRMIIYARQHKMWVVLSTNGMQIDEDVATKLVDSGLSKIIISLDGFNQASYESYRRGGDVEKVKKGIENLVRSKQLAGKKYPVIVVQTLVTAYSEKELPAIQAWVKSLGNVVFEKKSLQIYQQFELLPEKELYRRYKKVGSHWVRKKKPHNRCFRIWSQCVITHDGLVVPCCFDKNAQYVLGNLSSQSFASIWKGKPFNDFRKKILSHRSKIEMCSNCTE